MDKDAANPGSDELVPALWTKWTAGDGWTAIGGVPVFPGAAPTATQTGATTATVAFTAAIGGGDPFDYTVEKAAGPSYSSWTNATVGSTSGTSTVTLGITGLTTATSYKFRVKATGTNGNSSTSANSNSVTTS
nr:fibronectin type III domain-containing protein [Mycolicibacterium sp. BK634]